MLPAFLLSRKQKSLKYFFSLIRLYSETELTISEIWSTRDIEPVFADIKTLYRYYFNLIKQLDKILTTLSKEISIVDGSLTLPEIKPAKDSTRQRLKILFSLLDAIIEILHKKNISDSILKDEEYSFLNMYLSRKADIILLDSS